MVFVAYLANIPVRDMYPFMHLSPVFSVGITLGVLSLGMLFAYCGARLFGKTLSIYVLLFGVVSLVISMACGVVFVSETVIVYSHEEVEKRTHTMPVMSDTVIKVFPRAWGSYDMFGMGVPSLPMYRTRIEPSETENIELVIGIEHRGSHEIREQSKRFIEAVSGTIDASHALQLQVTPNTHEKFPLLFIRADIEVVKMPA